MIPDDIVGISDFVRQEHDGEDVSSDVDRLKRDEEVHVLICHRRYIGIQTDG